MPEGDRRMKKIAVASKDLVWGLDENLNAVRLMPGSRWEEFIVAGLSDVNFPDGVYRPLVDIAVSPHERLLMRTAARG